MGPGGMPPPGGGPWQPHYIDAMSMNLTHVSGRPGSPMAATWTDGGTSPSDKSSLPGGIAPSSSGKKSASGKKGAKKEKTRGAVGKGGSAKSEWPVPSESGGFITPHPMRPLTPSGTAPAGWNLAVVPPHSPGVELSEMPQWALPHAGGPVGGGGWGMHPNMPPQMPPQRPPNMPPNMPPSMPLAGGMGCFGMPYGGSMPPSGGGMPPSAGGSIAEEQRRVKPGDVLKKLRAELRAQANSDGERQEAVPIGMPGVGTTSATSSGTASPQKWIGLKKSRTPWAKEPKSPGTPSALALAQEGNGGRRLSRSPSPEGRTIVYEGGGISSESTVAIREDVGALDAKIDALLAAQAETQQQVAMMASKLGRLDALSTSVSQINLTLKRASDRNREEEASRGYSPARPASRLPGQGRPQRPAPPGPENGLEA